jgi:hypothetical protein
MNKEKVIETVKDMPENFDLDVLMERLIFVEKVEKGLDQLKNGQVSAHEDIKKMVDKWRK